MVESLHNKIERLTLIHFQVVPIIFSMTSQHHSMSVQGWFLSNDETLPMCCTTFMSVARLMKRCKNPY